MAQRLAQLYASVGQPYPPGLGDSASAVCGATSEPHNPSVPQAPSQAQPAMSPDAAVTGSGVDPPESVQVFCSFCGHGQPVSTTGQCSNCSLIGLLSLPPARGRVAEQPTSKAPLFKELPAGRAVAEAMGRRPQIAPTGQIFVPPNPAPGLAPRPRGPGSTSPLRRVLGQRQQTEARLQHWPFIIGATSAAVELLLSRQLPQRSRCHQLCPLVRMVHMDAQIVLQIILGKSQTKTSATRRSCSRTSSGPSFQIMLERSQRTSWA